MDLSGVLVLASLLIGLLSIIMLTVVLRGQENLRREVHQLRARLRGQAVRPGGSSALSPGSADAAEEDEDERSDPPVRRMTVVMNPSKYDSSERFRAEVEQAVRRIAGPQVELSFLETTLEDPGRGQARRAVEEGADLVVAAGGDGTVRMVASALTGTDVRMGIIPGGTGNLLARNLDVPLEDVPAAVAHMLEATDHRIDVGWLRSGRSAESAERAHREIFLVISGFGADAEIVGATDPTLKRHFGWTAYVVAGVSKLVGRSHDVVVRLPDGTEHVLQARTVLIGNVGRLPGGIVLLPDATIDNGHLEVLALGWRGAAGFGQILTQVVNPRLARGPKLSTMQRYLTREVTVASSKPLPVQIDGDMGADATHLVATIEPGALLVRAGRR